MHSTFSLEFAFLLGALHALEPGHGKTAMYVYMMQGRRSLWHPVLLGASSALSHSFSLAGIAFAVHMASHAVTGDHHHESEVANTLQWVSAGLVLSVGLYLLVQAARGRQSTCCSQHSGTAHSHHGHESAHSASHTSCCHGHSHDHDCSGHDHGHVEPSQLVQLDGSLLGAGQTLTSAPARSDLRITALLGLGVGLLPCPSALAAYFAGLSSGDMSSAWLTIGLFAGGIAASISAVGLLLQYFGTKLGGRMHQLASPQVWAWGRALVILSVGAIYLGRLLMADSPEHIHVH